MLIYTIKNISKKHSFVDPFFLTTLKTCFEQMARVVRNVGNTDPKPVGLARYASATLVVEQLQQI